MLPPLDPRTISGRAKDLSLGESFTALDSKHKKASCRVKAVPETGKV
jgi:hypothetical protein